MLILGDNVSKGWGATKNSFLFQHRLYSSSHFIILLLQNFYKLLNYMSSIILAIVVIISIITNY